MRTIPPGFNTVLDEILLLASGVEGHLIPKEIRFLALLAAVPSTTGEVLEIGSFKGKSTVVLAKAALLANQARIIAVDPLTSPSKTDPDLGAQTSGWRDFQANLKKTGVLQTVEFHQQRSEDLAKKWDPSRKLRLLWIDGDHTYRGAKLDFDLFLPFLNDGAIVAIHDVLHQFDGPARIFAEDMLLSPNFGAAGFCGSIGWAQYVRSPNRSAKTMALKSDLYRRLTRIIPDLAFDQELKGLSKARYKLARARIPHGEISPAAFLGQIQFI